MRLFPVLSVVMAGLLAHGQSPAEAPVPAALAPAAAALPSTTLHAGTPAVPSLLPAWRELAVAPVLHYQWNAPADAGAREKQLADFLAMGFTGVYKLDNDPPQGSLLFRNRQMHGLLYQTRFVGKGDPVLDPDGKPAPFPRPHPYNKSVFSERNANAYWKSIAEFAQGYGVENLFEVGGTRITSSWDETGLYSRRQVEYGYNAKAEFIAFLRDQVFHDAGPGQDSNHDDWTFNRATRLDLANWDDIQLPRWSERYARSGLWKYWMDFHGYYTHEFFRRGGDWLTRELGTPVELFTFSHATVKWPGGSSQRGLDAWWQARLNRVLTVEDCQWDYPGSTIHYALTDGLSRRYARPVLGWSWFSPDAQRARDPLAIGRALARAMGHNTHGLIMWVYNDAWRAKTEARAAMARWHHLYQAHWDFLRRSTMPAPAVAVLYPRNSGHFYVDYDYPKLDYGWTCQALTEAQIPFEVVTDNQVEAEPGILADYRVLLAPSATWESPQVRDAVAAFIAKGGYMYTTADSFALDTAGGGTTDFPAAQFGIRLRKKYKSLFTPSYDNPAEEQWARGPVSKLPNPVWEGDANRARFRAGDEQVTAIAFTDAELAALRQALPPTSGTGLLQALQDPRKLQPIMAESAAAAWIPADYRSFHDIVTGDPQPGATVLAVYGTEVCAVETEHTLWTGFRPGTDHAALYPVNDMRQFGEPIWPFAINQATTAAQRAGPRRWITRVCERAGITRPLVLTVDGQPVPQVELLRRVDPQGNAMVWAINHEPTAVAGRLEGAALVDAAAIANLEAGQPVALEKGSCRLTLAPGETVVLAIGSAAFVEDRLVAQKRVPVTIPPMP